MKSFFGNAEGSNSPLATSGTMVDQRALSGKVLATTRTRPPPLEVLLSQMSDQAIPIEISLATTIPTASVL